MPDYAKLYHILFHAQTQAIEILQKAQQEAEELYISSPEPEIRVLDRSKFGAEKPKADESACRNRDTQKQAPVDTAAENM